MDKCMFCKDEEVKDNTSFCSTECAFKDLVISSAGINTWKDFYEYINELFKGEFNDEVS